MSCQHVTASRGASSHLALLLGCYCLGVYQKLLVRKLSPVGLFTFLCMCGTVVSSVQACVWHGPFFLFFLARRRLNNRRFMRRDLEQSRGGGEQRIKASV
jgi:hypothetical protein